MPRPSAIPHFRVIVIKPSKYDRRGDVEQFARSFMPNAVNPHIAAMIPERIGSTSISVRRFDECICTDLTYLDELDAKKHGPTLVMLTGVQSHQMHRALDLAALAISLGCTAIIGGPHPMSCDTTEMQGRGVSFSLGEAENVFGDILRDAIAGELQPVYGKNQRWAKTLNPPVLRMPERAELTKYVWPMLGVYPARGCPYNCHYCSVIKVAGQKMRKAPVESTMASLRAAKAAKIKFVFFTSDNFNKYEDVVELCEAIIDEKLRLNFFIQCDTQIAKDPEMLKLFARAGVFQIFLGVETLNLATLRGVNKKHNRPSEYLKIREMCDALGINTHFSMINCFAGDTRESAMEQLEAVRVINPSFVSFYTLCPIPGTEQYDDFMRDGLITSNNLDRFDGTSLTWRHPHLSEAEADDVFRRCYREFYSQERLKNYVPRGNQVSRPAMAEYTRFAQDCAVTGDHPMSGGIGRVRLDNASNYRDLRVKTFGFELASLPKSLALSPEEQAFNDGAKLKRVIVPPQPEVRVIGG